MFVSQGCITRPLPFRAHARTASGLGLLAGIVAALASSAQATTVFPPSLNPGDTYQIIFVTTGTVDATSDSAATYNTLVANEAAANSDLNSLGTTWTALVTLLGGPTVFANTGLSAADTTTPFFNTAGNLIATGVTVAGTGLYGGSTTSHSAPILFADASSAAVLVWTGTSNAGGNHVQLGFTSGSSSGDATSNLLTGSWTSTGIVVNTNTFAIYGVSGVLTMPGAVPEPATIAMTGLGMVFLLWRWKRLTARSQD